MDNLNNIPNVGNWGDAASKLNDNFNKIKQAVTTVENTSKNNKGYFTSLSALNTAFPSPKAGQTAYVYGEASSTKYYTYNAVNGAWVATSIEAPSVGVDISEYTKTGGSTKTTKDIDDTKANHGYTSNPKTLKQVDDSLVQLAGVSFNRQGSILMLNKGSIHRYNGSWIDLDTRVYSERIIGAVHVKVEEGYLIYTGTIFNSDGTYNSMLYNTSSNRTEAYFEIPEGKFARIVFAKTDVDLAINYDEDIIAEYSSDRNKDIVQGYSFINKYVKELYLSGLDPLKQYYVSSISSLHPNNVTSIVIRTADENNTIVSQFRVETPQLPDSFISLSPQDNSGISGYAIVDWKGVHQTLIKNTEYKYPINEKVKNLDLWAGINSKVGRQNTQLTTLTLEPDDGVIATAWNYILKYTVDDLGNSMLAFSSNLGKTYQSVPNIYGDVVYTHFFSNGKVLFATDHKCYHFKDITNIQESEIYDYDGSVFNSVNYDFFQNDQSRNDAMFVNEVELVVWGSYSLGGSYDVGYVPRIWYSTDYGETIKCVVKFGETLIGGITRNTRHVHGALYNKYLEEFIFITGDAGSECMIIKGKYDTDLDTWETQLLGAGDEFKFGDVLFRDNFVYLVTDYTLPELQRGVLRCPYNALNDYSKYEYITIIDDYSGSLISFLEDENGNKLLFPDGAGRGKLWYCKFDFDFKEIPISESVVLTNVGSPNYSGEVYARKSQGSASFPFRLKPMVNLTKSMRKSGCTDFFVQYNVII